MKRSGRKPFIPPLWIIFLSTFWLLVPALRGITFPAQQSWSYQESWYPALDDPKAISATRTAESDYVVILDGEFLRLYSTNGDNTANFHIGPNAGKLAANAEGVIYVITNNSTITKYGVDGTVMGTVNFNPSSPNALVVDSQNRIFLATNEGGTWKIIRFSAEGVRELDWHVGEQVYSIALDPDNLLYVAFYSYMNCYDADGGQLFDYGGEYNFGTKHDFAFTSDGAFFGPAWTEVQHRLGKPYLADSPRWRILPAGSGYSDAINVAIDSGDNVYLLRQSPNRVDVMRRTYSGILDPERQAIPVPRVLSTSMVAGTNHVRIRYRVNDSDSETVTVVAWAVAEEDVMPQRGYWDHYSFNLKNAVPVRTIVGETAGVLGTGVPTNTEVVVDWDAGADIGTTAGGFKIYMMANDGRGLLNLHFLTIPAEGDKPALTLSRSPVESHWFYGALLWLYFTNPSDYAFSETGELYPVAGDYAGQWLTFQTQIGSNPQRFSIINEFGMEYVIRQLGYRRATNEEVLRAMEADTPGSVTKMPSGLQSSPPARPSQVNVWGFDVDSADDYLNQTNARDWLFWLVME